MTKITHEEYLKSNKIVTEYLRQMEVELNLYKRDTAPKSELTIDDIKISSRLYHLLKGRVEMKFVHQLGDKTPREYYCYRGVGKKVLQEIKSIMIKYNVPFKDSHWREIVVDEEI